MEFIFTILTTLSTFAAAIAAWFSFCTSKESLAFQKQFAKNRNIISQLEITLAELRFIRSIMNNSLPVSDELFISIDPRIDELTLKLHSFIGQKLLEPCEPNSDSLKNLTYLNSIIAQLESTLDSFF